MSSAPDPDSGQARSSALKLRTGVLGLSALLALAVGLAKVDPNAGPISPSDPIVTTPVEQHAPSAVVTAGPPADSRVDPDLSSARSPVFLVPPIAEPVSDQRTDTAPPGRSAEEPETMAPQQVETPVPLEIAVQPAQLDASSETSQPQNVSAPLADADAERQSGRAAAARPLGSDAWAPLLDGAIGARRTERELGLNNLVRRMLGLRGGDEIASA